MRKGIKIMNLLLCAAMLFGFGCREESAPISGGHVDRTDENAPKTIVSKDITEFESTVCLYERWSKDDHNEFHFTVKPDGSGNLTAAEEYTGVQATADGTLLLQLQEVIDRYDLAKNNGVYAFTAGLAPEFGAYTTTVRYASGEQLTFTRNNDPEANWALALCDVFDAWFASKGQTLLRVDTETPEL